MLFFLLKKNNIFFVAQKLVKIKIFLYMFFEKNLLQTIPFLSTYDLTYGIFKNINKFDKNVDLNDNFVSLSLIGKSKPT